MESVVNVKNVVEGRNMYRKGDVVVVEGVGGKKTYNIESAAKFFINIVKNRADYKTEDAFQKELQSAQQVIDLFKSR